MPEISVIVPVYKVEKYLDQCVKSIVDQTFKDFELILVDDGSPDRCPQMCDEWARKDSRIRVVHKENGGAASARNLALQIFSGRYVLFVDSDDTIPCNAMEKMYAYAQHYSCDIVEGQMRVVRGESEKESEEVKEKVRVYTRNEYLDAYLKFTSQKTRYFPWAKLYSKKVAKKIKYPEGLTSEDVEGTFRAIVAASSVIEISEIVYFYRVNESGVTFSPLSKTCRDMYVVWENVIEYAQKEAPEYVKKCKYNLERIDLPTYLNFLTKPIKQDFVGYSIVMRECRKKLKKNYFKLMLGPLPVGKKIILTATMAIPGKIFLHFAERNFRMDRLFYKSQIK